MSIRLITMDGGHVTPEIDSFLYRALMPRIAPTGSEEDIPAFADYLLYGGNITPMGVNVFIQKTVMLACGRIIEIPDSETIHVPADTSGEYTLVFRIQPSATNASDRVKAIFVPENGTFYTDDISTGTGTYDVRFAAVTVDETGFVTYAKRILPKMPVFTKDASESKMETDGQICVPTAEGVRKFVLDQGYFSKSSSQDRLWLLSLMSTIIESESFVTKDASKELDSLESAYSVYYPLNGVENSELWELFNHNAEGVFVSAFTYQGEKDGLEYTKIVQIAIPCALSLTKTELPNIATRTKIDNAWTEWNIAGAMDYTSIRNQLLATKLPSDITLDTLGEAYSVYFSLSASENVDLYNVFKGKAIGAFISASYIRDKNETVYTVQHAVPVVPVDVTQDVPSVATRSKIHGGKWSDWNTSGTIFSYVPAGEDDELDEAFGNEADGAFVATFAGDEVSMQIAVPVAGSDCPCIATRYGAEDSWSTWNTSGSGSTTVIEGEMLPADEYPVGNPYDSAETKQNLQDTITDGALFAIQTANKVPEMLTENSGIVFLSGEENLINSIYEYTEAIGEAQKAVVFPVREGATVSILFAGEKNYSNNNLYPVYALNYDFENKKSYAETSLTWHNKFTPSLSNEDKSTGMQALTTALFDVPISSDASVPYNAMALIIKDGDSYDYSNAFYVAQDALLTAATTGEVTSLKKGSTTFPVRDKKAREITDRLFINDKGELFIDGKKIGNN